MIADAPTDAALDAINERARGLADGLLALLDLGDWQCAYISAMQVLIGRCGLDPQQVLDAHASVISHSLCGDEPIRLVVARPEGNAQQEPGPERSAAVGSPPRDRALPAHRRSPLCRTCDRRPVEAERVERPLHRARTTGPPWRPVIDNFNGSALDLPENPTGRGTRVAT